MINKNCLKLYGITDDKFNRPDTIAQMVEEAIIGGSTIIQFRSKALSSKEKETCAKTVLNITRKYKVPLIIDDDVALAKKIDADGVHLGMSDMPVYEARAILGGDKIIGATAKTLDTALAAKAFGADYIGTGAAFPTKTKTDTYEISHDTIMDIAKNVGIPVVAIGGITADNAHKLKGLGINGIAVVSSLFSGNVRENAKLLRKEADEITRIKRVLSIAGSDCSGGAGIQADMKTITAHGMYAMTAITSLTAQNTTGVYGVSDSDTDFLGNQIDCIFKDIRPDAVKIGMLSNKDIIETVAKKLTEYDAQNIVIDPVMISTSGHKLLLDDAIDKLVHTLLPLGTIITPNIPETAAILEKPVESHEDMIAASHKLFEMTKSAVLIKGGHSICDADDLLYYNDTEYWFKKEKLDNSNTHGTGCTLSSAIACGLADGMTIANSVKYAKEYVYGAIAYGFDIGNGSGPLYHMYKY
ncbi:MAG: bifunctional hydroxymethylpyrimidine kinase/phosphomethylpyrimidine kinase [Lachnospiraceae bacterium]|nr:bifunctional hydroxymethylpyrimidine kinase/phosphomethylpyrimidine kinase [Lachnospiraceae bacterium]